MAKLTSRRGVRSRQGKTTMSLAVIGAGVGRTGTTSLKLALEELGLGPCYHMQEVFKNPSAAEHWVRAAEGAPMHWDEVFEGYASTTDWPACDYWQALAAHAPEAKIILTVRDTEEWFASTQKTIFGPIVTPKPDDRSPFSVLMRAIGSRFCDGAINDRDRCIAAYERHNASVRALAAPERLLVFDPAEGWEPLCRFIGVSTPAIPFPIKNTTADFQIHAKAQMAAAGASDRPST